MPVDTLQEMILGFVVLLGILLIYTLSVIIRTHRSKKRNKQMPDK
jgi:competence protein ComGF